MVLSQVYPSADSMAGVIIKRTSEGIQRMISLHNNEGDKEKGITTTKEAVMQVSLAAK